MSDMLRTVCQGFHKECKMYVSDVLLLEKDVFARGLFARLDDGLGESQSGNI